MLAMANDEQKLTNYFKKIKIVPVSISYEYDPTDYLKMPQLMAEANDEVYIKEKNEDFITLLSGIIGPKKHIHIHVGEVLNEELDFIETQTQNTNKQVQLLTQIIDESILKNYKLWPTNFIACDLINNSNKYSHLYTETTKNPCLKFPLR